jgi:hypothetical protein
MIAKISPVTVGSVALLLLVGSCTQQLDPKPLTFTQFLTGTEKKAWRLSSATIFDLKDPTEIKGTDLLDPCELDDQFIFYADAEKKLEYTNGATKCAANEPDMIATDTWELVQSGARLDIAIPRLFGGSKLPFVVKTLTANTLTVEYYFDIDASYRFTFTAISGK